MSDWVRTVAVYKQACDLGDPPGCQNLAYMYGTGLADLAQVVFLVADLADRGAAVDQHAADLAGTEPQLRVAAFTGEKLHRSARGPG